MNDEADFLDRERFKVDYMKKGIIVTGIVVLFVGLSLALAWNLPTKTTVELFEEVEHEWDISSEFVQGDTFVVDFRQYGDWSYPYYPEKVPWGAGTLPAKTFKVNITNVELNNYTLFEVTLTPPTSRMPLQEPYNFALDIYDITVTHHGAVITEDKPGDIDGTIKNDGLYLVNCSLFPPVVIDKYLNQTIFHHDVGPPLWLALYRTTTGTGHPYTSFLPIGIGISVTGATVSIWGARSRKHKIPRKRQNRKKNLN